MASMTTRIRLVIAGARKSSDNYGTLDWIAAKEACNANRKPTVEARMISTRDALRDYRVDISWCPNGGGVVISNPANGLKYRSGDGWWKKVA